MDALLRTIDQVEQWLWEVDTDPILVHCIIQYARSRGAAIMQSFCGELDSRFLGMAQSQDRIGWRRFMEGMLLRGIVEIQRDYFHLQGLLWKLNNWATGLIIKLLEVTHGQWLYRNVVVHDKSAGSLAVTRKEEIISQIEAELSAGEVGLLDEHKVNLDNVDSRDEDGDRHKYWLLAIRAAQVACAASRSSEDTQNLPRLRPRANLHPPDRQDYG